jgi:hypothetical protein
VADPIIKYEVPITAEQYRQVHALTNEAILTGMLLLLGEYKNRGNGKRMVAMEQDLVLEWIHLQSIKQLLLDVQTHLNKEGNYGDESPGTLPPLP